MGLGIKLLKNTTYLTAGNQIGNLVQFLFFLFFAREFGEKVVGQYSFAFSFTYLFSVFADLGLSPYMMREVARDQSETRQIFASCLTARLFALGVSALLAVAIILIFPSQFPKETISIIVLLATFQIFVSIADVFLGEFKGHDRMGLVALLTIFLRFSISGVGILLIIFQYSLLTVLTCFPIGSFVYLLICIILSFYYFKDYSLKFQSLKLISLFVTIFPFTLTAIFVEALYHQDILMIGFLRGDRDLGIFSAAQRIVLPLLGALVFVHTALLPTFSRLYVESQAALIRVSQQWVRYLLLVGLPIATGLFAISDQLILIFFSNSFRHSADVLKILSWTIALGLVAATYSVLLTAINRQTQKVVAIGICLAFNIFLNLLLIPRLSYNGAAIAKLLTEGLHLGLMAYLVSKYFTSISIHRVLSKPAISCLAMYFVIQFLSQWHLVFVIPLSALVYLLSLGALRCYSKEELEFVKDVYRKTFVDIKFLKIYR